MKKLLLFLSIIISICVCNACVGEFKYYDIEDDVNIKNQAEDITIVDNANNAKLNVIINEINLDDIEDGRTYQVIKYPEMSCTNNQAIDAELKNLSNKLKDEVVKFKEDFKTDIREMVSNAEDDSIFKDMQYAYTIEAEIVNNDDNYLSLMIKTYVDSGGAHPSYVITGHTYSVENQKETELYDFIKDKEELRQFLKAYAVEHKDDLYEDATNTIDNYIDNPPNDFNIDYHIDYYIQNHEFHVVFQAYELAPYAVGIIDIVVDNSLLKVDI